MRKILALSIILFLWINANGQNFAKRITLLQLKLIKSASDTGKISTLIHLGDLYGDLDQKNKNIAVGYYQKALFFSKKINATPWINRSVVSLAVQFAKNDDFKACRDTYLPYVNSYKSRGLFKDEVNLLEMFLDKLYIGSNNEKKIIEEWTYCLELEQFADYQMKDTLNVIKALKDEGDYNLNLGKLDLAKSELLQVVKQYKAIHFSKIHNTYYLLWAVSQLKGDEENELFYGLEMVKGMLATRDTSDYCLFYLKLADTYTELKMFDQSIIYYKKALDRLNEYHNDCFGIYYAIAVNLISLNKPREAIQYLQQKKISHTPKKTSSTHLYYKAMARCYHEMHQNQLEEECLMAMLKAVNLSSRTSVIKNQSLLVDYLQVGEFYINIKNFSKAGFYIKQATAIPLLVR